MVRRARSVRQRVQEVAAALAAMDVGEAESNSPTPCMVHQSLRRNRVMAHVTGSFEDGIIIDLTFTGIIKVPGSDEEE